MKAFALGLALVLASTCHGQTKSAASAPSSKEVLSEMLRNMPSEKELSELLVRADERVSAFEAAVKDAKLYLDRFDAEYAKDYLEEAAMTHLLISKTIKNGSTAYSLVEVLRTLYGLSLAADQGSRILIRSTDSNVQGAALAIGEAGTSCTKIATLIFDATLRLIAAEETALNKLLGSQNKNGNR